jgi:hypothetical protein
MSSTLQNRKTETGISIKSLRFNCLRQLGDYSVFANKDPILKDSLEKITAILNCDDLEYHNIDEIKMFLATINLLYIRQISANRVITACPELYNILTNLGCILLRDKLFPKEN